MRERVRKVQGNEVKDRERNRKKERGSGDNINGCKSGCLAKRRRKEGESKKKMQNKRRVLQWQRAQQQLSTGKALLKRAEGSRRP